MGVTIREVARHAGVSISTVSRVLNNTCAVNAEKRVRVEKAVHDLRYTPNPAARSLLMRETGGLGVLLPFVSGEFFSAFLTGADLAAQEEGFFLLISTSHHEPAELRAALKGMYRRVDGLIVMATQMKAGEVMAVAPINTPIVFANTLAEDGEFDSVTFDNFGGMYRMTRHLLDQGHRRITLICGPSVAHDATERKMGFLKAIQDAGVDMNNISTVPGDYTQKAGYLAIQHILKMDSRPTAVMASNDYCALGALSALRDAGIEVPAQIAVTGFDDVPSSAYAVPPLSSVHIPVEEMGQRAIQRLVSKLRGQSTESETGNMLPAEIVIRESSSFIRSDGSVVCRELAAE